MRKAYQIFYNSPSGEKYLDVVNHLETMGNFCIIFETGRTLIAWLIPDCQTTDALEIRKELSELANPFADSLIVIRIDNLDLSEQNLPERVDYFTKSIIECKGDFATEDARNFDRFHSRDEAYQMFHKELPRWTSSDGSGTPVGIDFKDWCWLPVKKDGMYERRKYEKYLHD